MPEDQKATRKLRAILSADVKGYSLLMADDEAFTIQTLKAYRKIMSELIEQHNGRVVDSPGDNILSEFSSAVDAVDCAVQIQNKLKKENAKFVEDKRLMFRIGVNIGDVVQDGDRIYGSGVNAAARIEGLADPGGVCISRNAYDHIKDKLNLGYEYLGQHEVKNIKDPVRVYKVLMASEDAGKLLGEKPGRAKKKWFLPIAVVAAIIVTSIVWYFYQTVNNLDIEPASVDKMAYPLPDKPSIAVLPFDNMSEDPSQEYFCDGMAEEIITALSKVPQLFVIARNSSFSYKGKPVKVQQISEELGVRYVLEGSVRKSGDKIRITAQLIDALKGHHLWAERYDRQLNDIFSLNDEITKNIISALQVQLTEGEQTRLSAKGTDNLEAYLKYLEGHEYLYRFNKDANILARKKAEEALALDPKYAYAYALLGKTYLFDVWFNWSDSPKESFSRTFELASQAISLDEYNFEAHRLLSHVYLIQREHDKAIEESEKAVSLAPSAADAVFTLGIVLRFSGKVKEAISMHEKAIRLNPIPPASYLYQLGLCYAFIGEYGKAIDVCNKALEKNPDDLVGRITLAIAYSALGQKSKAEAEAAEVLRISPNFTIEYAAKTWPYKNQADKDLVIDSLRKAGLPEKPSQPLPEKPSIAVLPFENLSDDPEQEYFSDGIAVEIINGLVRWPSIVIIPRSSSFIYKGKTVDVKQVGREMGVRYVLEGSVRREENRVRVNVQLVDVTTLKHLFSERYDREMKDIFAIQDEITMRVLTAMRVSLTGEGVPSSRGQGTKSIESYLKVLQAETVFLSVNRASQAKAKRLAEEAIALDPEYARAYVMMAATIGNEVLLGVYENPQKALGRAMAITEKAVQLDDLEESAHRVRGFMALLNKDYEKAIAGGRRALELAPNSVMAQIVLGYFLYSAGKTEEAIPILERAVALNPIPSPRALSHLGIAYRKARRYEEAVEVCRKLIQIEPNYIYPHLTLAATFAEIDKMEEAQAEIKEVLRINPKYSVNLIPRSFPWKDQAELDRLADSLRKAGLK